MHLAVDKPLCEHCSIRPAKLVIVRRLNQDIYRTFVCPECAEERTRLYVGDGLDLDRVILGLERASGGAGTAYQCRLCGTTLADLIVGGRPGCHACYGKFAAEIDNAIETAQGRTYHVGKAPEPPEMDIHHPKTVRVSGAASGETDVPEWIDGRGPDADVVISTRARLARSLAEFPFPSRASREDLSMVVRKVRKACGGLAQKLPGIRLVNVDKLSDEARSFLLDARLASAEQVHGGAGRAIVLEPRAGLSIMINEEDHLRLQAILSGLVCDEALEMVDWADDVLAARLKFGYSRKYGYLTASLSNVGTGLRVSALMHLAGLRLTGGLDVQLRAAYDLGVSIRGLFGEGTQALGDLFQVSNEVTLGLDEREIAERVRSVAGYLLTKERLARKELLGRQRMRVLDNASRSLRTLQSAMSVKPREALALMSPLRLATALGLVENGSSALMNELLAGMRVDSVDEGSAGIERAALLRRKLADVHIKDV